MSYYTSSMAQFIGNPCILAQSSLLLCVVSSFNFFFHSFYSWVLFCACIVVITCVSKVFLKVGQKTITIMYLNCHLSCTYLIQSTVISLITSFLASLIASLYKYCKVESQKQSRPPVIDDFTVVRVIDISSSGRCNTSYIKHLVFTNIKITVQRRPPSDIHKLSTSSASTVHSSIFQPEVIETRDILIRSSGPYTQENMMNGLRVRRQPPPLFL